MTDTDWQQTITSGWFIIIGSLLVLSVLIVLIRAIARGSASRVWKGHHDSKVTQFAISSVGIPKLQYLDATRIIQ